MAALSVTCAACGLVLLKPVKHAPASDRNVAASAEEATVPPGSIIILDAPDVGRLERRGFWPVDVVINAAGSVVGNVEDMIPEAMPAISGKMEGCCGPSGLEPNRACLCGAVVGTEISDCWRSTELVLNGDAVTIRGTEHTPHLAPTRPETH
jgi:hypothetical protein